MRKHLNNPKVVGALCGVAALCVGYSLWSDRAAKQALAASNAAEQPAEESADLPAEPSASDVQVSPEIASFKSALAELVPTIRPRDPFVFPKIAAPEPVAEEQPDVVESVHLSAVWVQRDAAFLILNGKIFRSGESLGGIKIDEISREGAWLRHWKGKDFVAVGHRFELKTPARLLASVGTR